MGEREARLRHMFLTAAWLTMIRWKRREEEVIGSPFICLIMNSLAYLNEIRYVGKLRCLCTQCNCPGLQILPEKLSFTDV